MESSGDSVDGSFFGFLTSTDNVRSKPVPGPAMDAEFYDMDHKRRGLAVIFSHDKFHNSYSARDGAMVDLKQLSSQLQSLSFEVDVCMNLTKIKIFSKLQQIADYDHSDCDCLVIVVMTHGDSNELSAYDTSYRSNKLWESFTSEKCKSLIGKPKLFFIQACRGSQVDDGARIAPFTRTLTDGGARVTYTVPSTADMLIANATFDGYYAWRNGEHGSWFVQELSKCLARYSETKEICQILTSVNRRVAITYESNVPGDSSKHQKKQMPNFLSTLTRELYLRRKPVLTLNTDL